jgi:hypothetical protein
VIENAWSPRCADKYADSAADNQRFGVIYGDSVAADQFDDIGLEWRAALKGTNGGLKMLSRHVNIVPQLFAFHRVRRAPQPVLLSELRRPA